MLKSQDIIDGLQIIVNEYTLFSTIWHIVFYVLIVALIAKWKPSNKLFAILTCLPALSVGVFAWLSRNPFNGSLFILLAILILIFGLKASSKPIHVSQLPFAVAGIGMIVFGLIYPHFIETKSVIEYLYASPIGLIPCPTLSILIGFLLLFNGFSSQSLTLTLIFFGLFYGIFGVLKLAVYLDLFLVFGTITLLLKYILSFKVFGSQKRNR